MDSNILVSWLKGDVCVVMERRRDRRSTGNHLLTVRTPRDIGSYEHRIAFRGSLRRAGHEVARTAHPSECRLRPRSSIREAVEDAWDKTLDSGPRGCQPADAARGGRVTA